MMFLVHLEISFRMLKLEFVIVFETIYGYDFELLLLQNDIWLSTYQLDCVFYIILRA